MIGKPSCFFFLKKKDFLYYYYGWSLSQIYTLDLAFLSNYSVYYYFILWNLYTPCSVSPACAFSSKYLSLVFRDGWSAR